MGASGGGLVNVADLLGPWHNVEVTDAETGELRTDKRRVPQFLHDHGAMEWRDVAAQAAESIPPQPSLGIWRVWCSDEQLQALAADATHTVLRSAEVDAANIDADTWPALAVTQERDGEGDAFPPLPESGWLEAGAVYQHGDGAVIVRQSHQRSIYAPEDTPALFMVYRPDATDVLAWVAGEQVIVGTRRMYEGTEYECLQAHVTQSDWTPDATPSLWAVVVAEPEPSAEWAVGVAYAVGDVVTYQGRAYQCRQAHTSIATWTPPLVQSLWLPL
jgi:hypothetical protein